MTRKRRPRLVDHVSDDSEDEEISEDDVFNSDDERKYGIFFQNGTQGSGDEDSSGKEDYESDGSQGGSDGDSDTGDGGQYMLDLLDKLDVKKTDGQEKVSASAPSISSSMKESEFASSVVPKAGLTLESLLQGLEDTKGFGAVQKSMKKVAQGRPTDAPIAKTVSDRVRRKVHYEDQSKEVSLWIDAVQENRRAETLDFRPKERMDLSRDSLVEKFVPTTDFEKQIHAALQEAGQNDEAAILMAEESALNDDLGANEITLEEYKKRRGQLAKMRALMFYHEQKQHRIKKIKSKKYRRIRKRQRERQKEADVEAQMEEDPDLARELAEKEEIDRRKVRMTLAHPNTSKWAKRVLKRGKNVDVDTRRALSAQLKRGDDLLQKMKTTRAGEDEDDSDEDLADTARKVLADTEGGGDIPVERQGLFKLSFMQKGIERQRQQARQEARQLLEELEADEKACLDTDSAEGQETEPTKRSKPKAASKDEMKGVLGADELVAAELKLGNSSAVAISGDISIGGDPKESADRSMSVHTTTIQTGCASVGDTVAQAKVDETQHVRRQRKTPPATKGDSNPWLVAQEKESTLQSSKSPLRRKGVVDVERAADLVGPVREVVRNSGTVTDGSGEPSSRKITTLTQEELVKRAFATSSEKDLDEEFAAEKAATEEREDATSRRRKKDREPGTVAGWGSWAGEGAPPPGPRGKLPKRLQPPAKKLSKRKRADEKKSHVIISEKRMKKTADNFMLTKVPYPFTSREEYEVAMSGGVGREWNVTSSYKDMTRPEVITRVGKIIQPLSKKVKQRRPKAKLK